MGRLLWERFQGVPDLQYILLPPYEIPDLIVVSGLIVENRGQKPANNIKISIEYDDPSLNKIHHMEIISDEEYILRGGGEQYSFATLRLRQMKPGSKVIVYFASSRPLTPRVSVTSFEASY
ncbi:MAG: hypothetical protein ACE5NP_08830 [Anaerolineae bacterium]